MTELGTSPRTEMDAVDYLLYRGEANPRTRSGFVALELLDRPADWDRLREALERASRVVPRMRHKVVVPSVPTTAPRWVVDPDFDLSYHLRRIRVPEPGTLRQVLDLAEVMVQSPLDASRALWEVTYVEGLEGNRAALLTKLSHAVTDGVGAAAMFEQVYDLTRRPAPRALPPLPVPEDLTPNELARAGLSTLPGSVLSTTQSVLGALAGTIGQLVRRPGATTSRALGFARSTRQILGPPTAGPSPLLRRRSLSSRTEVLDIPLADLRRAAKAAGGSVNDAYLAALCGALRLYHEKLGVPVDTLPMAIPVSLRAAADPQGGNRFAGIVIAAPIGEANPADRIRLIRTQVVTGREEPAVNLLGMLAPVTSRLPAPLLEAVAETMRPPDVQASNVPGMRQDTFIAGAKIDKQYALGPLPGVAMMAIMASRAGTCFLAVRYDTSSVTDAGLFESCLQAGVAEVLALGESEPAVPAPSRRRAR